MQRHYKNRRFVILLMLVAITLTVPMTALADESFIPSTPRISELNPDFSQYIQDGDSGKIIPEPFALKYPVSVKRDVLPVEYSAIEYQSKVKNQGENDLCWSFSFYAGMEANMILNEVAAEPALSPMHMAHSTSVHTSSDATNYEQGFVRAVNGGGNRSMASAYLMRGGDLSGAVNEEDDPYNTSRFTARSLSETKSKPKSYTVQNIRYIGGSEKSEIDYDVIKRAVMTYGAVPCSMYADDNYWNDDSRTAYYYNVNDELTTNHGVAIVGWDDNYSSNNFKPSNKPSKNGAWLVKNSWGDEQHNGGYFWMSYEDKNSPLNPFVIDGVEPYDENLNVYEHDPHGANGTIYYENSQSSYAANVFTVNSGGEIMKSVKIFAPQPNSSVDIYVIKDYQNPNSLKIQGSSDALIKTSASIIEPGYYTIDLENPVLLGDENAKFAVVVNFTVEEDHADLPVEKTVANYLTSSSDWNESFISNNGINWSDLYKNYPTANFSIKAVTTSAAPIPAKTTTGIIITFSQAVSGLTREHITVDGATKGSLEKWGDDEKEWLLFISDIEVSDGGFVKVKIENFDEYLVETEEYDVMVYVGE